MTKSKKAKFFCENCGAEVPENAKLCKKCGKFFISVRCPNCGRTGTSKEFKKGCPSCGYAAGKSVLLDSEKTYNHSVALNKIFGQAGKFSGKGKKSAHENSLPAWIYVLTFGMLIAVMIGIYSCIKAPSY